jgi:hypothetical protein
MKSFILVVVLLGLLSCTSSVVVQRNTEALSQSVYAVKDSLDVERVDMASRYINVTTNLVPPPKERIVVEPIIKTDLKGEKKRTIIVPDSYKGKNVVVIGSVEWDDLIKEADNAKTYKQDLENYKETSIKITEELQRQIQLVAEIQNKIDTLKLEKSKLETLIWKQRMIILILTLIVGIYILIKIYNPSLLRII